MLNEVDGFTIPRHKRYFEDYHTGLVCHYGNEYVDEADIIEFAERFDPQWIHTDPETASDGPFGGLIASGWHTASLMMRIFASRYLNENASMGGPGVDELRWVSPVRPGDILSARFTVVDARRSRSKPDRGIVHIAVEVCRDGGEVVMTMRTVAILRTRPL